MKKFLLALAAMGIGAGAVDAQTRLTLYEEFSGENCAPCAASNPALWALISANPTKVMMIKYQSPIPSAGPIYNQNTSFTLARLGYYAVTSAPFGYQNGNEFANHIAAYRQDSIDNSVSNAAPFAITVTHTYNATADSVTANISITSTNAYAPSGANLKLRIALIEHLEYCTAPGTNGETEFHNVVREMYPNAGGTQLQNSWGANETQTYSIKGKVPAYFDRANSEARLVVFVQNDANKNISQAAVSTHVGLPVDASLKSCPALQLSCATSSVNVPSSVTLTNTGTTPMTSATVYYNLNGGVWSNIPWTGTLAPGATTTVAIPAITMGVGVNIIKDSVAMPNAQADLNTVNNTVSQRVIVRSSNVQTLPAGSTFESSAVPANWLLFDHDGNGSNWALRANVGHNSVRALYYANYLFAPGEVNTVMMPNVRMTAGTKSLDFWYAYAQYSNENDKLEVAYSTDCGASWNPIWSESGDGLATRAPVGNNTPYTPQEGDWKMKSLDVSSVPDSAIIGFRATSDYGNNLYLDDVNVRNGEVVGVDNVVANGFVSLHPNPARDAANLEFNLNKAGKVSVVVYDAVGRAVATPFDGTMAQGAQRVNISTSALAAGMYNVNITTQAGKITQRLSVVK